MILGGSSSALAHAVRARGRTLAWCRALVFVLARKMLSLLRGDFVTTAEFIDRAAGSHIAEAFRSAQERLERGIEEDINTAVLETAKTVAYNEGQIRVLIEIMAAFLGDDGASVRVLGHQRHDRPLLPQAVLSRAGRVRDAEVAALSRVRAAVQADGRLFTHPAHWGARQHARAPRQSAPPSNCPAPRLEHAALVGEGPRR